MAHMFYKMVDDCEHPTKWWLDEVQCLLQEIDSRVLNWGQHFEPPGPLIVTVKKHGEPQDVSFTLDDTLVVTTEVADVIDRMAPGAVERFPVEIFGVQERGYEALNVVRVIDAVDRERSKYGLWKPEDDRPDKLGDFRGIYRLVIRDDIKQEAGIFRLKGWIVALVVSAQLKNALEKIGRLGVLFRPLEGGFTAN